MREDLVIAIKALPRQPSQTYIAAVEELLKQAGFQEEVWVEYAERPRPPVGFSTDFEYCDSSEVRGTRRWSVGFAEHAGEWCVVLRRHDGRELTKPITRNRESLSFAEPYVDSLISKILLKLGT